VGKGWRLRGLRRGFPDGGRRVPKPTPISISTDSLVHHRPAQLGVTMGALQSCAGPYVRTDCLWVEIGTGQALKTKATICKAAIFNLDAKAKTCSNVGYYPVLFFKVISELQGSVQFLQAVVAGDGDGGSHVEGRV
jgi:hypothetical protein